MPVKNVQVSRIIEEKTDLLEIEGANRFACVPIGSSRRTRQRLRSKHERLWKSCRPAISLGAGQSRGRAVSLQFRGRHGVSDAEHPVSGPP